MELKRLDSDLKKLYDNNLVDLISGYLMPVGTGPVPFFFRSVPVARNAVL